MILLATTASAELTTVSTDGQTYLITSEENTYLLEVTSTGLDLFINGLIHLNYPTFSQIDNLPVTLNKVEFFEEPTRGAQQNFVRIFVSGFYKGKDSDLLETITLRDDLVEVKTEIKNSSPIERRVDVATRIFGKNSKDITIFSTLNDYLDEEIQNIKRTDNYLKISEQGSTLNGTSIKIQTNRNPTNYSINTPTQNEDTINGQGVSLGYGTDNLIMTIGSGQTFGYDLTYTPVFTATEETLEDELAPFKYSSIDPLLGEIIPIPIKILEDELLTKTTQEEITKTIIDNTLRFNVSKTIIGTPTNIFTIDQNIVEKIVYAKFTLREKGIPAKTAIIQNNSSGKLQMLLEAYYGEQWHYFDLTTGDEVQPTTLGNIIYEDRTPKSETGTGQIPQLIVVAILAIGLGLFSGILFYIYLTYGKHLIAKVQGQLQNKNLERTPAAMRLKLSPKLTPEKIATLSPIEQDLIQYLRKTGGFLNMLSIEKDIGYSRSIIYSIINQLEEKELLTRA